MSHDLLAGFAREARNEARRERDEARSEVIRLRSKVRELCHAIERGCEQIRNVRSYGLPNSAASAAHAILSKAVIDALAEEHDADDLV